METTVRRLYGQEKLNRIFEIAHASDLPLPKILKAARRAMKDAEIDNAWITSWSTHHAYNDDSRAFTVIHVDFFDGLLV